MVKWSLWIFRFSLLSEDVNGAIKSITKRAVKKSKAKGLDTMRKFDSTESEKGSPVNASPNSKIKRNSIKNIYLHSRQAIGFKDNITYDINSLEDIAKITRDFLLVNGKGFLNILDIGVGNGIFSLPFINYLMNDKRLDFSFKCFDISSVFLKETKKKIFANQQLKERAVCFEKDANHGILDIFPQKTFDVIICTFVLQYINDWKLLLEDIFKCLKSKGIFIQAEIIGDLKNVDGSFDENSNELIKVFWQKYFEERKNFFEWNPSISVTNLSLVFNYCHQNDKFKKFKEKKYLWTMEVMWKDFCSWIRNGIFSSLGSDLKSSDRKLLSQKMKNWLSLKHINLHEKLTLKWGFKITWMIKKI
jgi:ubiquinone/menaquinone biosynthesis C-methylase UbiE